MSHLKNISNWIIKRTPLLCGLLFAAIFSLLPISAGAQCKNWDAGGAWNFSQPGQVMPTTLRLEQAGRVLTGTAKTMVKVPKTFLGLGGGKDLTGTVDGTIDRDSFNVKIYWSNGDTGVYNGTVLPSGRLDGEGYEKRSPNIRVPWHSDGVLKCVAPPVQSNVIPQPPKPKIIRSSGKMPKTAPAPPPPPPMKVPGIVASQVIYSYVGAFTGFATLTWDAGPDHPYAEVWFKENNGDAAFLVEQGKGSRQVTVQRGLVYTYILTDAGKTLATVVVVGQ